MAVHRSVILFPWRFTFALNALICRPRWRSSSTIATQTAKRNTTKQIPMSRFSKRVCSIPCRSASICCCVTWSACCCRNILRRCSHSIFLLIRPKLMNNGMTTIYTLEISEKMTWHICLLMIAFFHLQYLACTFGRERVGFFTISCSLCKISFSANTSSILFLLERHNFQLLANLRLAESHPTSNIEIRQIT